MPPRASAPARKFSRPLLLLSADPQIFGQANSAAAGSPAPNTADAFVEFATQRSVVNACLHTSADSTKAYAHAAESHLTSRSNIPLSCGSRTTCRHTPNTTSPRRTASGFFSSQLSLEIDNSQLPTPRAFTYSNSASRGWRADARPKASAWEPSNPQVIRIGFRTNADRLKDNRSRLLNKLGTPVCRF